MLSYTVDRRQMSPLTRELFDLENEFLKSPREERTIKEQFRTTIVGRVLTLGVSLLLHVESVCRAVYVCFLSIQAYFARANEVFVEKQRQECREAYRTSVGSFFACFRQKVLSDLDVAGLRPPAQVNPPIPAAVALPVEGIEGAPGPAVAAQMRAVEGPLAPPAVAPHVSAARESSVPAAVAPEVPVVGGAIAPAAVGVPPIPVPLALNAAVEQPGELERAAAIALSPANRAEAPASPGRADEWQLLEIHNGDSRDRNGPPSSPPAAADAAVASVAATHFSAAGAPSNGMIQFGGTLIRPEYFPMANEEPWQNLLIHERKELDGEEENESLPVAPSHSSSSRQVPTPAEGGSPLLVHEPFVQRLVDQEFALPVEAVLEKSIAERENRIERDLKRIEEKIRRTLNEAKAQMLAERKKVFLPVSGPSCLRIEDPRWSFLRQPIDGLKVGGCQYSDFERRAKGTHLAVSFNVKIGQTEHPVQLFGVFDAFGGPEAAQFLKNNVVQVFSSQLKKLSNPNFDKLAIWNALKTTFVELDKRFKSEAKELVNLVTKEYIIDHGATAILAVIINNELWTVNLGNGRAVLKEKEGYKSAIQLSVEADPKKERIRKGVEARKGHVSKEGLVCGLLPTAKGIGFNFLQGAIGSRPEIAVVDLPSNSRIVLASGLFFKSCSTIELGDILSQNESADLELLAFNFVYSVQRKELKGDLGCIIIETGEIARSRASSRASFEFIDQDDIKGSGSPSVISSTERKDEEAAADNALLARDLEALFSDEALAELNLNTEEPAQVSSQHGVSQEQPPGDAISVPMDSTRSSDSDLSDASLDSLSDILAGEIPR